MFSIPEPEGRRAPISPLTQRRVGYYPLGLPRSDGKRRCSILTWTNLATYIPLPVFIHIRPLRTLAMRGETVGGR